MRASERERERERERKKKRETFCHQKTHSSFPSSSLLFLSLSLFLAVSSSSMAITSRKKWVIWQICQHWVCARKRSILLLQTSLTNDSIAEEKRIARHWSAREREKREVWRSKHLDWSNKRSSLTCFVSVELVWEVLCTRYPSVVERATKLLITRVASRFEASANLLVGVFVVS